MLEMIIECECMLLCNYSVLTDSEQELMSGRAERDSKNPLINT